MKSTLYKIYMLFLMCIVNQLQAQNFTFEWAKFSGGSSTDVGLHIATDVSGNVYTAGRFMNTVDFDPSPTEEFNLTSAGDFDMFLQKLDADGLFIWAIRIGGAEYDQFSRIAIAPNGDICAVASFKATVDFDPGAGVNEKTTAGVEDIAVLRFSSAGVLIWVQTIGGDQYDYSSSCDVDQNGRVLVSGTFSSTCEFKYLGGSVSKTSAGNMDVFTICYNANGSLAWIKTLNGASNIKESSSVFDAAGNVIIAGYFRDTAVFEPGMADISIISNGESDVFVMKLNSQGNLVWLKAYGGVSYENIYKICTDSENNILLCGYFYENTDLDPGPAVATFTVSGTDDCFIQKLSPEGNLIWVRQIGGINLENTYDIACDADNSVYVVGDFLETVDFDPGVGVFNLTSAGNNDIFTLKLNSAGLYEWAYKVGANYSQAGYAICVDADKNVYTTGTFSNKVDFNPTSGFYNSDYEDTFEIFTLKIGQGCLSPVITSLTTSVSTICQGETIDIHVNGQLNGAEQWVLSLDSCEGTILQTSTNGTLSITIEESSLFFVKGSGGCLSQNDISVCNSINLVVNSSYNVTRPYNVCRGESLTLPDGSVFNNIQESFNHLVSLSTSRGCDSLINYSVAIGLMDLPFEIRMDTLQLLSISPDNYVYTVLDCDNNLMPVNVTEISGGVFKSFLLPTSGSYAIAVTSPAPNNCNDTTACQQPLNSEMINSNTITIYPNPFTDKINIQGIPKDVSVLKLYNMMGQEVSMTIVQSEESQINELQQLSTGVYFLHVIGKTQQKVFKVIKQ